MPPPADRLARLRGRTAIVTGASSGIGAGFARHLAAEGLAIVAVARRRALLDEVAAGIEAAGGRCEPLVADLADPAGRAVVADVLDRPDVGLLVNNAGAATHGPLVEASAQAASEMVAVNVAALVDLTKRAADAFSARGGGGIINVASTAAFKAMPGLAVYGASKAFVKELSLCLRLEVRNRDVDVCVVCPGPVRTPMLEEALGRPIAPRTWIGRFIERSYFMDVDTCVERSLAGFRAGKGLVVVDPVDRAMVRLPRPLIERIDDWSLRHLTGAGVAADV